MGGNRGLPRVGFELRILRRLRTGTDLARDKRLKLAPLRKLTEQDDALAQLPPVVCGGEKALTNAWMGERIGGGKRIGGGTKIGRQDHGEARASARCRTRDNCHANRTAPVRV